MDKAATPLDAFSAAQMEFGDIHRLLLQASPGMVLVLTLQGRVLSINPAGAERLGQASSDAVDADLLVSPLPVEGAEVVTRDAALQPGALHEWTLRHRDGSTQSVRLAIAPLAGLQGGTVGLIAVEPFQPNTSDNVSIPLQHHDALTGLPTQAVLTDRAEMALQRAARHKYVVAILVVEIAGFEALRREYGAGVSDDVLRATASRLHFELRKTDTAVRLGGGQFAVMLVDLHRADEALQIAGKMQQVLSAPVNAGGERLPLVVRIGVACSPTQGDQLLPLFQAAEAALVGVDAAHGGLAEAPAPVTA